MTASCRYFPDCFYGGNGFSVYCIFVGHPQSANWVAPTFHHGHLHPPGQSATRVLVGFAGPALHRTATTRDEKDGFEVD